MNKVFKVIWSEARNAYVVVSEIAKNHGSKSCSTKKLLTMLIATGVMTCASMAPAMAAPASDVNANSIQTNVLNSKYNLSVGTQNVNGTMPFFVNSNGAFYAASGKLVVDKDGNVTAGNVVLNNGVFTGNSALRDGELYIGDNDGNYSQITPKSAKLGQVTIDEKGNIASVNSIQTNALNAKYNLSVGTANENGTMPFFVNSNGAFYGANGSFVVDKDGNVTAGNVVLNNGVFYKNSALRDGELFIGDNDGNYSQITTKGAKLGKVTVAEDGKISGVAAGEVSKTSTDAINGSQLNQTNENVAQNKADIAANKTAIEANRADIDKNKADIAANKTAIEANKTAISDLNTRVDSVAKQHTTVKAGDKNIIVAESTNKDGGKEYTVALDKNINVDKVTAGDTTISDKGLEIILLRRMALTQVIRRLPMLLQANSAKHLRTL